MTEHEPYMDAGYVIDPVNGDRDTGTRDVRVWVCCGQELWTPGEWWRHMRGPVLDQLEAS